MGSIVTTRNISICLRLAVTHAEYEHVAKDAISSSGIEVVSRFENNRAIRTEYALVIEAILDQERC